MAAVKKESAEPKVTRRDKARATRLRMIRAAHSVFVERGYGGARMSDIAEAAGVAVQTLYFTFHTKPELLQACYDTAVLGEGEPLPPHLQPWYAAMMKAKTGRTALRHFAEGNTAIASRVALLDDVVRSASHEPEAATIRGHAERLRREGYRGVVEHLDRTFGLHKGLDVDSATDIMLMLGGAGPYRTLVAEYGWPEEKFVDWLADALARQLL